MNIPPCDDFPIPSFQIEDKIARIRIGITSRTQFKNSLHFLYISWRVCNSHIFEVFILLRKFEQFTHKIAVQITKKIVLGKINEKTMIFPLINRKLVYQLSFTIF